MKKLLSIILATAILLSLIPAAFASDTEEKNVSLVYYFNKLGTKNNIDSVRVGEHTYETTGNFWRYHSMNPSKTVDVKYGAIQIPKSVEWVAVGIYVPVAGEYSVNLSWTTYKNHGAIGGMYILPKGITDVKSAFEKNNVCCVFNDISYIDTSLTSTSGSSNKTADEKYNFETPGEYIVVFKREANAGNNEGTNDQRMYPVQITLTQGDGGKTPFASVKEEINVGEKVTITPYDSNVRLNSAKKSAGLTYSSDNPAVAVVDAETGVVTGVANGTAVITAAGDEYKTPLKVTVKVSDPALPLIKYNLGKVIKDGNFKYADKVQRPVTDITEALTNGFFRFSSAYSGTYTDDSLMRFFGYSNAEWCNLNIYKSKWVEFEVYVPEAGIYDMSFNYVYCHSYGGMDVYVNGTKAGSYLCYNKGALDNWASGNGILGNAEIPSVSFNKGWNKVKFYATQPTGTGSSGASISSFSISAGTGDALMPSFNGNTTLEVDETATLSGFLSSTATAATVTYESSNDCVTVGTDGTITAAKPGKATVTMTASNSTVVAANPYTVEITVPNAETDYVSVAIDDDGDGKVTIAKATLGEEVTATANVPEGKIFRGWVRGSEESGRLVSTESTYTFKAMTNIYLTAVYTDAPTVATDEYYNWDGQFLGNTQPATVPSLVGYTFAKTWTKAKVEDLITSWIADFTKNDETYDVTGTGFTMSNADSKYDTKVTCTADSAVYWYRDGKLVDYGTEYKFFIWDDTTVTTSNEGHNGAKLMLDAKKGNSYMVEYDAGNATLLEVGILFGDTGEVPTVERCQEKMSSQRDDFTHGQFTATSDYPVARGYLIYQDGNTYRVIYAD